MILTSLNPSMWQGSSTDRKSLTLNIVEFMERKIEIKVLVPFFINKIAAVIYK